MAGIHFYFPPDTGKNGIRRPKQLQTVSVPVAAGSIRHLPPARAGSIPAREPLTLLDPETAVVNSCDGRLSVDISSSPNRKLRTLFYFLSPGAPGFDVVRAEDREVRSVRNQRGDGTARIGAREGPGSGVRYPIRVRPGFEAANVPSAGRPHPPRARPRSPRVRSGNRCR